MRTAYRAIGKEEEGESGLKNAGRDRNKYKKKEREIDMNGERNVETHNKKRQKRR